MDKEVLDIQLTELEILIEARTEMIRKYEADIDKVIIINEMFDRIINNKINKIKKANL